MQVRTVGDGGQNRGMLGLGQPNTFALTEAKDALPKSSAFGQRSAKANGLSDHKRNISLHMSTMHNPVPFFDMEAEIQKEKNKI